MALSEGLIFGGAYLRREICVSKLIGLALASPFTLYLRAIFQGGTYIWRGDLTEGFVALPVSRLIFGGAYTWRGLFSEFYGIITLKYHPFTTCTNRNN